MFRDTKWRVTYQFSYAMRHNDADKMTPHPLPYASFPELNKIDSFLKLILNIFILGNLIVGWGEVVIKEGAGTRHQIYRFIGDVNIWGK